ncbi:MAG: endonuclease III [bacterium]|nr:endonuclease III [bacterium]
MTEPLKVLEVLKKHYPNAKTELKFKNPFQLLIATILSAQCTDERVNKVTPILFSKYPTPHKLAKASSLDVEKIIKSTGFYKQKAKSIINTSKMIVEKFSGEVPANMEQLIQLPGVARKTANVVLTEGFGIASGVVVDTHVRRVSYRIGLTDQKNPEKIEKDLMNLFPKSEWRFIGMALILHGRKYCKARNPKCNICPINKHCKKRI